MRPGTRKAVRRMVHPRRKSSWTCGVIVAVGGAGWLTATGYAIWQVIT
ncbi:MAG: hypothetical protein ACRDJ9_33845 [Dehalococcoidia bacterium]